MYSCWGRHYLLVALVHGSFQRKERKENEWTIAEKCWRFLLKNGAQECVFEWETWLLALSTRFARRRARAGCRGCSPQDGSIAAMELWRHAHIRLQVSVALPIMRKHNINTLKISFRFWFLVFTFLYLFLYIIHYIDGMIVGLFERFSASHSFTFLNIV